MIGFQEDDARLMAPLLAELDPEDWEDADVYESIDDQRIQPS